LQSGGMHADGNMTLGWLMVNDGCSFKMVMVMQEIMVMLQMISLRDRVMGEPYKIPTYHS
jgi:hypothetical protein